MKSRLTLAVASFALVLTVASTLVFADSLKLTKIGLLDLGGNAYSEWWYTGTAPVFYGTADPGADIELSANDEDFDAVANSEGNWDIPTALVKGDYDISITAGDASYSFKLHLGQEYGGTSSQTSSSSSTVPATGSEQTTALMMGLGVSMLALYFYFFDANKKHKVFEKDIVSDR